MEIIEDLTQEQRFYITEASWYRRTLLLLLLLITLGLVGFLTSHIFFSFITALLAFIAAIVTNITGKKHVGTRLEITKDALVFTKAGETTSISYNNIRSVQYAKSNFWQEPAFTLQLRNAKAISFNPSKYVNRHFLIDELKKVFESNKLKVE
ncbi:MAG: hypothetical protein PHO25_04345 [Syntrophomonadaceae bacterium]|nr:hypothetical protein [Syntrophomonadaceae bacterium]